MFRSLCLAFMFSAAICLVGQQPVSLSAGQQVTLHGKLVMRPAGRLQFVAVKSAEVYAATLQGHSTAATHDVGLSNYNRYDLLYAHRGEAVVVSGTVLTDEASPYYLHNVSLKATSIRLANGTDLLGKPRPERPIAVDVGQYQASVLLPADPAAPWQYSAHGQPDPERQFLSCSSNGGGDVVNCYCAKGFQAATAASATKGVKAEVLQDTHTAQFGVGEGARQVELTVTCSR